MTIPAYVLTKDGGRSDEFVETKVFGDFFHYEFKGLVSLLVASLGQG